MSFRKLLLLGLAFFFLVVSGIVAYLVFTWPSSVNLAELASRLPPGQFNRRASSRLMTARSRSS